MTLGAALGAGIWLLSPWLTGAAEPWDANAPIWPLSWLVVAVLGGLSGRLRGVCLPLGYALGQMLVTIRPTVSGEFGFLGWLIIGGFAAVSVAVTLAIAGVTSLLRRQLARRDSSWRVD